MIERPGPLSLRRQCVLLGLNRAALYYRPVTVGAGALELMALPDRPFGGLPDQGKDGWHQRLQLSALLDLGAGRPSPLAQLIVREPFKLQLQPVDLLDEGLDAILGDSDISPEMVEEDEEEYDDPEADTIIGQYYRDIRREPLLTADQEKAFAKMVTDGDDAERKLRRALARQHT